MKRPTVQLPILGAVILVIIGGGMLAWHLRERTADFYTDAGKIRLPAADAALRDVVWQPAEAVAGSINTAGQEYEPRVSADGTTLLFVRGDAGRDADIYIALRDGAGWSEPAPLASVNSRADDLGPELSTDGATLYFYSSRAGGRGGYDLWISQRTPDGWAEPVNAGPRVNTAFNEYGPCLTPDTSTLYFASDRPRDDTADLPPDDEISPSLAARLAGDYDLFASRIMPDGPERPERVDQLNSPYNEGAAAISPLGDFLYFSSDRPGGFGGFDLYRARRGPEGLLAAEPLDGAVNTPADELDPTCSAGGFGLHFTSNRAIGGSIAANYDLYHAVSREVFRDTETYRAEIDWGALFALLGPLLAYLILVLVLIFALMKIQVRHKQLTLLARCVLTSLLVHALVLLCTTALHVTSSLFSGRKDGGGTKVVLESSAVGREIAGQVRGGFTEVATEPTLETPTPRQFTTVAAEAPATEATMNVTRATMASPSALASEVQASDASVAPAPLRSTSTSTAQQQPSEIDVRRPDPLQPVASREAAAQANAAPPQTFRASTSSESAVPGPQSTAAPNVAVAAAAANVLTIAGAERMADPVEATESAARAPSFSRAAEAVAMADQVDASALRIPAANSTPTTGGTPGGGEPEVKLVAGGSQAPRQATTPLTLDGGARPGTVAVTPAASSSTAETQARSLASVTAAQPSDDAPTIAMAKAAPAPQPAPTLPSVSLPGSSEGGQPDRSATELAPGAPAPDPTTNSRTRVAFGAPGGETQVRMEAPALEAAPPTESLAASQPPSTFDANAVEPFAVAADRPGDVPNLAFSLEDGLPSLEESAAATEQVAMDELDADAPGTRRGLLNDAALRDGRNRAESATTETHPDRVDPLEDVASLATILDPAIELLPVHLVVEASDPVYDRLSAPALVAIQLDVPPTELPPEMQYLQRSPQVRTERLESMGGSKQTERAVMAALAWLARHQSEDGSWSGKQFDKHCGRCGGASNVEADTALTGLALLAFLAADHSPTKDGQYREGVRRAIDWLLAQQEPNGSLIGRESMYSHGIATISLAEAYGMSGDRRVGEAVKRAVDFIYAARNKTFGGWRYKPGQIGDTSVLGWQVMALTSARRAGVDVPDEAFEVAGRWLPKVADPCNVGLYSYQPAQNATPAMTAEAMFIKQLLGSTPEAVDMQASADYVVKFLPSWRNNTTYFWYYATLALFQHGGSEWERWNEAIKSQLLRYQERAGDRAGSWPPHDKWATSGGRVYQTALCALTLEVYYRYLPLYARDRVARQQ